jgi:hypothetical protein
MIDIFKIAIGVVLGLLVWTQYGDDFNAELSSAIEYFNNLNLDDFRINSRSAISPECDMAVGGYVWPSPNYDLRMGEIERACAPTSGSGGTK